MIRELRRCGGTSSRTLRLLLLGWATLAGATSAHAGPPDGIACLELAIALQETPAPAASDPAAIDTAAAREYAQQSAAPAERHRAFKDLKPAKDMWRGIQVAGGDAVAVVTGPFHMDRSDAMWTLAAVGATGLVYAYDQEILDAFLRNSGEGLFETALDSGEELEKLGLIGTTAPYWLAGLTIGYVLRFDPLTRITSEVIESHVITGLLRQVLEQAVGRTRPVDGEGPYNFEFREGDSFPSGHASVVFEVATVASYHTRSNWLRAFYYSVASAVALQRMDSQAHWPSDVIAGACIGTLVARTIVRRHAAARAAGR